MANPNQDQIIRTLATAFENASELWSAMGRFSALLSGSRSLNLFVEGSCGEASDWDFYVSPNGHCVVGMIKALQAAGVVFDHPFVKFEEAYEEGGEHHVTKWEAMALLSSFDSYTDAEKTALGTRISRVIETLRNGVSEDSITGRSFAMTRGVRPFIIKIHPSRAPEYEHLPGLHVMCGRSRNGHGQAVQLMYAPKVTPTGHVLRFHSSGVQSFLSPFGAGHLYHSLAVTRQSWIWYRNTAGHSLIGQPRNPRHDTALQKYRERGWEMITRPAGMGLLSRNLMQDTSLFVAVDDSLHSIEPDLGARRTELLRALSWFEQEDLTTPAATVAEREPAPRQQSLPKDAFFADAELLCVRFAIHKDNLSWADPNDIVQL